MKASPAQLEAMRIGGAALARVKKKLRESALVGVRFEDLEALAQQAISQEGFKPSFSTVPGYHWATCIMKNHEVCHGIPQNKQVDSGDLITIDVGLICQGYHLDTTTSFGVGEVSNKIKDFLRLGVSALSKAISKAKKGSTVYDISLAMQKSVESAGCSVVYQLTGHGIGKQLHMDPAIPCYADPADKNKHLQVGQTLAIEVMYTQGKPDLIEDSDGWTFITKDRSLSAMFEETVIVGEQGPEILTTL